MNFTLKQLRYVEAAGRCGSITNAAEILSISQSSITAAIDALEKALGFDLFIRMPAKGIQPTPAGLDALGHIRSFLEQTSHLDSDLRSIGGQPVGVLRLACYVTTAPHVLPLMLKGFVRDNPGVRIELTEGDMVSVVKQLLDGSVDLACTYSKNLSEQVSFTRLFTAPPYAIISAEDSLARKSSVTLAELAERPMIVLDLPFSRDYYADLFYARGLRPTRAHSTRSSEIVRALAAGGFGFSILNIRAREVGRPEYACLPITDPIPEIEFGIVSIAGVRHPRIIQAFLDHCAQLSSAGVFDQLMVKLEFPGKLVEARA
jgi:DNA-binding transcriptional LysR family regulator